MFINTLFLSFFSSLDAFGIGITYGLKNIKFSIFSQFTFFFVALISTTISVFLGGLIKDFLSPKITNLIGAIIIIGIGIYTIFESFKNQKNFDFDNSCDIDIKESVALSLSVTADSLCIGLGSSLIGINNYLFPILVASFHLIFLLVGNTFGKNLIAISKIPHQFLNVLSGIILIILGICRLL